MSNTYEMREVLLFVCPKVAVCITILFGLQDQKVNPFMPNGLFYLYSLDP